MFNRKHGGKPTCRPDAQTLDRLYKEQTARQIADRYGVQEVTVRAWIRRYRREQEMQREANGDNAF